MCSRRENQSKSFLQNLQQFRRIRQGVGGNGRAPVDAEVKINQAIAGFGRGPLHDDAPGERAVRVGGHVVVGHLVVDPVLGLQGEAIKVDPAAPLP